MRRATIAVAVLILAASCSGAGHPSRHTITGTLTLLTGGTGTADQPCLGTGGYSDINAGTQVTISNQSGTVVGVGQLGLGISGGTLNLDCLFPFTVVAGPADIYEVEVSHRGNVDFSAAQMTAQGWAVQLTLGQ